MDPLSDVLRAIRLTGAYFFLVEAATPWSVSALPARQLTPRILPEAEHLIAYHVLSEGECWVGVPGLPEIHMQEGDVIVFPHGDGHFLSSHRNHHFDPHADDTAQLRYPNTLFIGKGQCEAKLVCGFLGCDVKPFNPLLAALPRVMHMPRSENRWLAEFPKQVVHESRAGRRGSETMLTRMAELMFLEVVRKHLESMSEKQTGWLAGLRDPIVGAALSCLHERANHNWSLPELAKEVAASRTVLAERFAQIVGVPPMQYLAQWRLQLAAELLARGDAKVSAVGSRVGYDSEAAFSRAFKRTTGVSPATWRKQRQV